MDALSGLLNQLSQVAVTDPFTALLAAFVFGQAMAWTYEVTYRGLSYSRSFNHAIVLTTMSAAMIVLAMGRSLVAGLGLLGVLSMVRFRTTLKSSRDLVFIMGAATVGVACGVDAILTAACGAVGFAIVALYLHRGAFGSRSRFDGVVRFRVAAAEPVEPRLSELLADHCSSHVALSLGEVAGGDEIEHAYQVKFWDSKAQHGLLAALRSELKAADVVILLQETGLEY